MPDTIKVKSDWFSILVGATGEEYVASTGDEVLVVALTDSAEVLLGVEPSAAFGRPVRLLPGGQVEPDLTLAEVANKELQEEIGYKAGRLDFLGELMPWAKYLAVRSHVFLARDLTPSRLKGDEGYEVGIDRMRLADLEDWIADGRLADARVVAALFLARARLAHGPGNHM